MLISYQQPQKNWPVTNIQKCNQNNYSEHQLHSHLTWKRYHYLLIVRNKTQGCILFHRYTQTRDYHIVFSCCGVVDVLDFLAATQQAKIIITVDFWYNTNMFLRLVTQHRSSISLSLYNRSLGIHLVVFNEGTWVYYWVVGGEWITLGKY